VVGLLVKNRWPFRLHATYDESITRFLDVMEAVNAQTPFNGLRWYFDHAETISEKNLGRVKALGGGIAIQNRMSFQGESFISRYGQQAAGATPPFRKMIEMGLPVAMGTDATRVSSYNPWVALHWLVTGKTLGGTALYPKENLLDRHAGPQPLHARQCRPDGRRERKGGHQGRSTGRPGRAYGRLLLRAGRRDPADRVGAHPAGRAKWCTAKASTKNWPRRPCP
jgi:hypothetical protein